MPAVCYGIPTERNGVVQSVAYGTSSAVAYHTVYESHPMDSRIKELDGISPTVSRKWHKGAADTPLVCEQYVLDDQGGQQINVRTDGKSHTLRAEMHGNVPAVVFSRQRSDEFIENTVVSTQSARQHKDATDLVVEQPVDIDRAFFNQGQNAQYEPQYYEDGTVPTLVARGPSAVAVRYIVRRLTPTECARLQGFADLWGHPDYKEDFTDEEWTFWAGVRNTHAAINGKATKSYTREQMVKWYNGLHTDSAEYKMWGNGIALPCARYVMEGIAEVARGELME